MSFKNSLSFVINLFMKRYFDWHVFDFAKITDNFIMEFLAIL